MNKKIKGIICMALGIVPLLIAGVICVGLQELLFRFGITAIICGLAFLIVYGLFCLVE